ncbi:MAG: response regulator [Actinobacteria bacterium]|nr:response regulator [Actinomycetota bacterium]
MPVAGGTTGRFAPVREADVLVVEDAPEFAQMVTAILRKGGHRVRTATTIADAVEALAATAPDLIVLDLTLPDGDGLDLCRTIRERSNAYILVLSGRDDEIDKLLGFKLGADDYVTKPFSPRELAARVEALLRRPRVAETTSAERMVGHVTVRPEAREVEIAGQLVDLTRIEFDLLDTLSASPKVVFTRAQLLERVWGPDWYADDHVVDVHVANLRKKIDRPGAKSVVRTVRGVGYGITT